MPRWPRFCGRHNVVPCAACLLLLYAPSPCGPPSAAKGCARQHVFINMGHKTAQSTDRHPARPLAPLQTSGTTHIPQRHVISTHRVRARGVRATIECENVLMITARVRNILQCHSGWQTRMRRTTTSSRFVMYRNTSDINCNILQHIANMCRCPEKKCGAVIPDRYERKTVEIDVRCAPIAEAMSCMYGFVCRPLCVHSIANRVFRGMRKCMCMCVRVCVLSNALAWEKVGVAMHRNGTRCERAGVECVRACMRCWFTHRSGEKSRRRRAEGRGEID